MIEKSYFNLAINSLKHRKKRTFLTIIGIFIGIAAVVSLVSLSQGLGDAIKLQFQSLGSDKIIITASGLQYGPPGSYVVNPLTKEDLNIIKKVGGVKNVAGRLIRTGKIDFKNEEIYSYIISLPKRDERKLIYETLNLETESGRLIKDSDFGKNVVLLGNNFAHEKVFKDPVRNGDSILIQDKEFYVVGIADKLGNPQIDNMVLIPDDVMRNLLNINDELDVIVSQVDNEKDLENVADEIGKELRKKHNVKEGEEDFKIQTPQQLLETLSSILLIIQVILIGIASIALVVGGIGIMNTMYTAVLERNREIGIMKAIGAMNRDIFLIFLTESGLLGIVGGLIGVILGMSFSYAVSVIGNIFLGGKILAASFSPFLIIGVILFSFLIGSISGTLPAIQAAKLKPVEALRKWLKITLN